MDETNYFTKRPGIIRDKYMDILRKKEEIDNFIKLLFVYHNEKRERLTAKLPPPHVMTAKLIQLSNELDADLGILGYNTNAFYRELADHFDKRIKSFGEDGTGNCMDKNETPMKIEKEKSIYEKETDDDDLQKILYEEHTEQHNELWRLLCVCAVDVIYGRPIHKDFSEEIERKGYNLRGFTKVMKKDALEYYRLVNRIDECELNSLDESTKKYIVFAYLNKERDNIGSPVSDMSSLKRLYRDIHNLKLHFDQQFPLYFQKRLNFV